MTTVIVIIISLGIFLFICSMIETRLLKITRYTIDSPRIPDDLNGMRVVLLSDLHCTSFGRNNLKMIKKIASVKPSAVIIAGDLINGTANEKFDYAANLLEVFSKVNIPVYYAFGNHEERLEGAFNKEGAYRAYSDICSRYAFLLNNDSMKLTPRSRTITGPQTSIFGLVLPDEQFRMKLSKGLISPVGSYIGDPDPDGYNILIAHDPSYYREYLDWGADLILSGHLHGGIIRLPLLGGLISPRYSFFPKPDKGRYDYDNDRTMIISGGVGWHNLPVRFLNRPEIVAIDFKRR